MKLDILVFSAHPDDAEVACGGTVLRHRSMGRKIGFVDLTRGELGTRGTPEIRLKEAAEAAQLLKLTTRINLNFRDGFFQNDEAHQREVIRVIRQFQPDVVLVNAPSDRHPDHIRAAKLVVDACFYAGLSNLETCADDQPKQESWEPSAIYHYIQDWWLLPDLVVDVSEHFEQKVKAAKAYRSQFYDPESQEPVTCISDASFFARVEARAVDFGHMIGATYGEGFLKTKALSPNTFFDIH